MALIMFVMASFLFANFVCVVLQMVFGAALISCKGRKQLWIAFAFILSFPTSVLILSDFEITEITSAFGTYAILSILFAVFVLVVMVPSRFSSIIIFVFGIVKPIYDLTLYALGVFRGIKKRNTSFDEFLEKVEISHLNYSWIDNDIYITLMILLMTTIYLKRQFGKYDRIITTRRNNSTAFSVFVFVANFLSFSYFI